MKKISNIIKVSLLCLTFIMASCSNDDFQNENITNSNTGKQTKVTQAMLLKFIKNMGVSLDLHHSFKVIYYKGSYYKTTTITGGQTVITEGCKPVDQVCMVTFISDLTVGGRLFAPSQNGDVGLDVELPSSDKFYGGVCVLDKGEIENDKKIILFTIDKNKITGFEQLFDFENNKMIVSSEIPIDKKILEQHNIPSEYEFIKPGIYDINYCDNIIYWAIEIE